MADATDIEAPPKKGGKGFLLGLIAALALGGGGFYASFSGLIPPFLGGAGHGEAPEPIHVAAPLEPVGFVPLDQMILSLGSRARSRHLRFTAQLEVEPAYQEEVELLRPRIMDVLNTYLRAVDERDLEEPSAMTRLRAQMLRRVQVVAGEGRVRDLLVTEFVLN